MKHRVLIRWVALILLITLPFTFPACGNKVDDLPHSPSPSPSPSPVPPSPSSEPSPSPEPLYFGPELLRDASQVGSIAVAQLCEIMDSVVEYNVSTSWGAAEHLDSSKYVGFYLLAAKDPNVKPQNMLILVYQNAVSITIPREKVDYHLSYYYSLMFENVEICPNGSLNLGEYQKPSDQVNADIPRHHFYYLGHTDMEGLYRAMVTPYLDRYDVTGAGDLSCLPVSSSSTPSSSVSTPAPFEAQLIPALLSEVAEHSVSYDNGDCVYTPSIEKLSFDEEARVLYFTNSLTVYLLDELSADEKESLAASVGGVVSGTVSGMNILQIVVADTDLAALESYADQLMRDTRVLYATYLYPLEINNNEIKDPTNSPWEDPDQQDINSTTVGGNDWWAEAIGAYKAWEYSDQAGPVIVGIIDDGFDARHEDFQREGKSVLHVLADNTVAVHGTHVAGLIAAQDNQLGIRGVADRAQVLCVDYTVEVDSKGEPVIWITPVALNEITSRLVEYAASSGTPIVINNSWGIQLFSKEAYTREIYKEENERDPEDYKYLLEYLIVHFSGLYDDYIAYKTLCAENSGKECILGIVNLLHNGYDKFILVQSSGNGKMDISVEDGGSDDGIESRTAGYYCSIDKDLYNALLSLEARNWLAKEGITFDRIKEHIIRVGAVDMPVSTGTYPVAGFSNYGDTVDICAPGVDIYSTIPTDKNGNRYAKDSGTSMSAPLVTGSAAFVWSLDPTLSAGQVKELLKGTAHAVGVTGPDAGKTHPMLNVGQAAEAAFEGRSAPKEDLSLYIPIVQAAINELSSYGFSGGFLYDMNGDGVRELVYLFEPRKTDESGYESVTNPVCSVYTIRDSKAYALLDRTSLPCMAAGNGFFVGTAKYQNNDCFVIYTRIADQEGSYENYSLYDPNDFQLISTCSRNEENDWMAMYENRAPNPPKISFHKDRDVCTEQEYLRFVDALGTVWGIGEPGWDLGVRDSSGFANNSSAMTLGELLAFLNN